MTIEKYGKTRFWAVYDEAGKLICLCVYKKGGNEVKARLSKLQDALIRLTATISGD